MKRMSTQPIVAETIAHARRKVEEQEQAVASMRIGDPHLPGAMVELRALRENLDSAELNDSFS